MEIKDLLAGLKKGERVAAVKTGYGKNASKLLEGTLQADSYGMLNYIVVKWDDGSEDRGFAHTFRDLRKIGG
jgi:hypothetical protein